MQAILEGFSFDDYPNNSSNEQNGKNLIHEKKCLENLRDICSSLNIIEIEPANSIVSLTIGSFSYLCLLFVYFSFYNSLTG